MRLGPAVRSEFTKFFSTSAWWILGLIMVAYLAMLAGGFAAAMGAAASGAMTGEDAQMFGAATPKLIYGLAANTGYIYPLMLGTLLVTTEFRHRTLIPTFLAAGRRGTVLVAKLLVAIVVGALFGVAAVAATVGGGAGALAATGQPTQLDNGEIYLMLARTVLAFALWAVIGVGVGSIMRNQVAAIVTVLAFTQFVEPIARSAATAVDWLADIVNYLPSAASDILVGSSFYGMFGAPSGTTPEWWVGAIVLAVYGIVLTLIGALTTWRRDID